MDTVFTPIGNKALFVDDIALLDTKYNDHLNTFATFIELASRFNINVNWNKSKIGQSEITFCGYKVAMNIRVRMDILWN